MKGTIKEILYQLADEIEIGDTVRYNHTDCVAGEDTRRRLYVTRKPDILLGYCHNCSSSSSYYMSVKARYRHEGGGNISALSSRAAQEYTPPVTVLFTDTDNIPAEAEAWRIRSKLSRQECDDYCIAYDPANNGIVLPFYTMEKHTNGHQLRPLHKRGGAKYVNYVKYAEEELGGLLTSPDTIFNDILVVVEDLVSGIHIVNAGYNALVNYGVNVKPAVLHKIPKSYDDIVIWLDNDNTIVNRRARDMLNIMFLYRPEANIRLIKGYDDPKNHDKVKLREVIHGRA